MKHLDFKASLMAEKAGMGVRQRMAYVTTFYHRHTETVLHFGRTGKVKPKNLVYRPTFIEAQEFLRSFKIEVWAQPYTYNDDTARTLPDDTYSFFIFDNGIWVEDGVDFENYYEAFEKGLEVALKHLTDDKSREK